jgi:hypothetical protein
LFLCRPQTSRTKSAGGRTRNWPLDSAAGGPRWPLSISLNSSKLDRAT